MSDVVLTHPASQCLAAAGSAAKKPKMSARINGHPALCPRRWRRPRHAAAACRSDARQGVAQICAAWTGCVGWVKWCLRWCLGPRASGRPVGESWGGAAATARPAGGRPWRAALAGQRPAAACRSGAQRGVARQCATWTCGAGWGRVASHRFLEARASGRPVRKSWGGLDERQPIAHTPVDRNGGSGSRPC